MDIANLFRACRIGDLQSVKALIEAKDVDINVHDQWNSSPLYYACLCGHIELVRFLLENGARCDINTFDGERCVYGALTNEIRNILVRDYKVISQKVIRRNAYDEFFRKSFENGDYCDVVFNVRGDIFKAHKCILVARCHYFEEMFANKWRDRSLIQLKHQSVTPDAFRILLYFLYTGIIEFPTNLVADVLALLRQCKLHSIYQLIKDKQGNLLLQGKTKKKARTSVFLETFSVAQSYDALHQSTLPNGYQLDERMRELREFSDVIFRVEGQCFHCHKVFIAGRSDFFNALLLDHFCEQRESIAGRPVFELNNISAESFISMISFIYTNHAEISLDNAFELLYLTDEYLMVSLKKLCAKVIGDSISQLDAVQIIQLARMMNLSQLESTAIEYISNNLSQFLQSEDFKKLIISDAKEIRGRHETDTIGIIDDIRYHLTFSANKSAKSKLEGLETLLHELGLKVYRLKTIY